VQKNMWNAIFDFSGEVGRSHWRILPLEEVVELHLELDEPPDAAAVSDSPVPKVTYEMLCAKPLTSGESCGQGVANIPQTRPDAPPAPAETVSAPTLVVKEGARHPGRVGVHRLESVR